MLLVYRLLSPLFPLPAAEWKDLTTDIPELQEMEPFVCDLAKKEALLQQIKSVPLHERGALFTLIMRLVEDENLRLLGKMSRLRRACKAAHELSRAKGYRLASISLHWMDDERFWKLWPGIVQEQYEFFERNSQNLWLESVYLDQFSALLDHEAGLLVSLRDIAKRSMTESASAQETAAEPKTIAEPARQTMAAAQPTREPRGPQAPSVTKAAVADAIPGAAAASTMAPLTEQFLPVQSSQSSPAATRSPVMRYPRAAGQELRDGMPQDDVERMWRNFISISKTGGWRCDCDAATGRCCRRDDETMLRLLSQELHEGALGVEEVHRRFVDTMSRISKRSYRAPDATMKTTRFPCLLSRATLVT